MTHKNKTKQQLVTELETLQQEFKALNKKYIEQKYRILAENIVDVIWVFDLEKRKFTYVSPSVVDFQGFPRDKIRELGIQDILTPESFGKLVNLIQKEFQNEQNKDADPARTFSLELEERQGDGSTFWVEFRARFLRDESGKPVSILGVSRDINDRKQAELALKKVQSQLEEKVMERTAHLNEANIALKTVLKNIEKGKEALEEKITCNVKDLIMPALSKLKKTNLNEKQQIYLDILESNLNDIVSPFLQELSFRHLKLTPMEIQVANLVKQGMQTKEIANLLHLSLKTIEFHRDSIRKKIGIKNKKINLQTYLQSIQ